MTRNTITEEHVQEYECQPDGFCQSDDEGRAPWNVSDLTEFRACPGKIHHKYVLHELGTASIKSVLGGAEHSVRANLSRRLLGVYVTSCSPDEIISQAYPTIDSCIKEVFEPIREGTPSLAKACDRYARDLKERLSKEEDLRAYRAGYLLRRGLTGIDVARALLPVRVEYPLHSDRLSGRIDAVYEFEDKSVPVEYKTCGYWPGMDISPWELQVAAYCMLLSEKTQRSVDYGILYFTRTLTEIPVVLTDRLRNRLNDVLAEIEEFVQRGDWTNCPIGDRCSDCPYSESCKNTPGESAPGDEGVRSHSQTPAVNGAAVYDRIMSSPGQYAVFDSEVG